MIIYGAEGKVNTTTQQQQQQQTTMTTTTTTTKFIVLAFPLYFLVLLGIQHYRHCKLQQ